LDAARTRVEQLMAERMDCSRDEKLEDDIAAFAATLRSGLDQLDFKGRRRLVRLLIERVVVTSENVAIEHAIPLSGRFAGLQQERQSLPMRVYNRLRLYDCQSFSPVRPESFKDNPEHSVRVIDF